MSKRFLPILILLIVLVLTACTTEISTKAPSQAEASPTTPAKASAVPMGEPSVLISEVLTGIEGNNNLEFIELTNTSTETPFDLKAWGLWYKIADGQEETLIHRWHEHTLIPPQGHYLLVRTGQDAGLPADIEAQINLIPQKGGLQLRATDGTPIDSLAWGAGPTDFAETAVAPAMGKGVSLERAPGGGDGNFIDTDDNAADFSINHTPNPQNIGSPLTPDPGVQLFVSLGAPKTATPGNNFAYLLTVDNQTGQALEGLTVQALIPLDLEIQTHPDDVDILEQAAFWEMSQIANTHQIVLWTVGGLEAGQSASTSITVSAPWTVETFQVANYSAQAENWDLPAFGAPVRTSVEGGVVPIGNLNELVGAQLTIEGTATMPTGALYAGTGNVKFYLEDETGGVQVWVPEGEGAVGVGIGSQVRVQGKLEVYRGALELIANPADVEILVSSTEGLPWPAAPTDFVTALNAPEIPGRLITVEGQVTRNDEFSYSYEIDLLDENGETMTLYVDKQTDINVEAIEPGQSYRATGIIEIYNTERNLYPRVQSDLERIYPPVLMLEISAPITVLSEEVFEVILTAYNYTPDPLTNLTITATMPLQGAAFDSASEGGEVSGSNIIWTIPEIAGEGESASVSFWIQSTASEGYLTLQEYRANATEWPESVGGEPYFVFVGDTVPIWAIQGPGFRSPYIMQPVTTRGIVTGVFPELGGFWIQESDTDQDPLTSAGLFIATGAAEPTVVPGDELQINGVVRETSQQTQIAVAAPEDITLISEGNPLPVAIELDPPADLNEAIRYYEAIEGMLAQVTGPALAVSPISKYGEYVLVQPDIGVSRLYQGQDEANGVAIMVDDGSEIEHFDASTYPYIVNTGDTVSGVVGPLAYTYGHYKIEPVTLPEVTNQSGGGPFAIAPAGATEFSIMTWNVENLFDLRDPHPSNPPMLKPSEYRLRIEKIANTIEAVGAPLIVGLQEVENITVLEDIATHEILIDYGYQALLIEGFDSRGIDNGYLVRGDRVTFVDLQQFDAPEGLTSRPPLLVQVEIETDNGPVTVFVINNHFTSMSAGVEATEPRRDAQAAWNVEVLQQVLQDHPEAYVAVIGDLNSFYDSRPIDTLREAGLNHVFEILPAEARYSYIYQGLSQTLDHILVTAPLFELLARVEVLHVNADYALPFPDDPSPLRTSDHDPVVAVFEVR